MVHYFLGQTDPAVGSQGAGQFLIGKAEIALQLPGLAAHRLDQGLAQLFQKPAQKNGLHLRGCLREGVPGAPGSGVRQGVHQGT